MKTPHLQNTFVEISEVGKFYRCVEKDLFDKFELSARHHGLEHGKRGRAYRLFIMEQTQYLVEVAGGSPAGSVSSAPAARGALI